MSPKLVTLAFALFEFTLVMALLRYVGKLLFVG